MFPPPLAIFPHLARRRPAARNFLTRHGGLLVCTLFLLTGLATAGDYGIVGDEPTQRQIARANLDYILGRADYDGILAPPAADAPRLIPSDRYYGIAFELPLLLAEQALGLEDYHYVHRLRVILTHLFFIVGGYFCYRLAYRLFNNRLIALFALLLFLLHPRIYGHSFFNSKDPVFLAMFSIALYLLERAFRRDTAAAFALLGIAVGLLVNLRIMGGLLFFAVIAMRGLDWFQAKSEPERKGILRTGGLFVLMAAVALYALSPYAWRDPIDYLATSLELTGSHPTLFTQLFQGEWVTSDQPRPHYTPVWFAITTPLPLLLLGGLGAAAVAAQAVRQPPALFRNGNLRFQLLLLTAFLLPPLAAVLLGSIQYGAWRHFFFLYAPFCLLAAGGLHWIAASLPRRRPWRLGPAGAYGLAGLGLGLILLQITQLHPLQHLYFNSLVDRTTPEYLRTQYHLRYWELARWAAFRRLLKDYPGETLTVRTQHWGDFALLPPADRGRLQPASADSGNADYDLLHPLSAARPDLRFNSAYPRLYRNTILPLRPLDSARMTPAASAAYREIYRQALAHEPLIRADYHVYRHGQRLTFVKENCPPDSPDAWFGVQPFPPLPAPPKAAATRYYLSRDLSNHRVRLDNLCLAVIQLPPDLRGDILLSQRHLGPFHPKGPALWTELYSLSPPGLQERVSRRRQGQAPAAPNAFEVFLDQDPAGRHRLIYAKANCAAADYDAHAFLHIHPKNRANLPFYQWPSGVANREFPLARYGLRLDGECLAVYPLPPYPIAALLTGQAGLWETNLYPPANPDTLRAAYAALANRQPNAQSNFALYLQDSQLTYLRETCAPADTAANFFLHITPIDTADLPPERQDAGFANQDFPFARYGGPFDGQCLATVPLPDYPIKTLRTGQYTPNQGELWSAEFTPQRN